MKTGDTVPVTISGDVVAQAKVVEIDRENSTATLIVPATKVVMGIKVELDVTPPAPAEPTTQHIVTGVDRVDADGNIVEPSAVAVGPEAPVEPVESPAPVDTSNSQSGDTPTGTATATELVEPTSE